VTANGINTMTLQAGGNIGGQTPDVGSAAEVSIDTTSLSATCRPAASASTSSRATAATGSPTPRSSRSPTGPAGRQLLRRVEGRGLATPTKIVSNFDFNEAFGGPIKRDKVWFWFSTRYNASRARPASSRTRTPSR
jgi:hypothetical protein